MGLPFSFTEFFFLPFSSSTTTYACLIFIFPFGFWRALLRRCRRGNGFYRVFTGFYWVSSMHTSGDWDLLVGEKRRGGGDEKYVAPRVTDRHILRSSNSSSTSVSSSLFFLQ